MENFTPLTATIGGDSDRCVGDAALGLQRSYRGHFDDCRRDLSRSIAAISGGVSPFWSDCRSAPASASPMVRAHAFAEIPAQSPPTSGSARCARRGGHPGWRRHAAGRRMHVRPRRLRSRPALPPLLRRGRRLHGGGRRHRLRHEARPLMRGTLIAIATALVGGVVFGLGLAIAQMTDPSQGQEFPRHRRDCAWRLGPEPRVRHGRRRPMVAFFGLRLNRVMRKPIAAPVFHVATRTRIDRRLAIGSALFGIGWGISGLCPGPAIADLGIVPQSVAIFVVAMLAGSWLTGAIVEWSKRSPPSRQRKPSPGEHAAPVELDILVVGSGPVGLAAALNLDALGYRVTIVRPAARPDDHRTAALLAGSVAFLEDDRRLAAGRRSGGAPQVPAHRRCDPAAYSGAGGALSRQRDRPRRLRLQHRQCGADRRTRQAVRRARHCPRRGKRRAGRHDRRRHRRRHGWTPARAITARLVAAADGRRSRVREEHRHRGMGLALRSVRARHQHRHELSHEETSTEFHTEGGPFTLVPLPGRRSSLVWVDRPAEASVAPRCRRRRWRPRSRRGRESILGKITLDGPAQVFPLSGMGVRAFAAQRAVLLGEAAHLFPPIGAQGLNLGYSDVAALGEDPGRTGRTIRARRAAWPPMTRARRADIYARTAAVDALNRTLLTGFLPVQALRGLGLFLLDRIPAMRRAVMRAGRRCARPASETDRSAGRRSAGSISVDRHRDDRSRGSIEDRRGRPSLVGRILPGHGEHVGRRRQRRHQHRRGNPDRIETADPAEEQVDDHRVDNQFHQQDHRQFRA